MDPIKVSQSPFCWNLFHFKGNTKSQNNATASEWSIITSDATSQYCMFPWFLAILKITKIESSQALLKQ